MKKAITLSIICYCLSGIVNAQQLNKKESREILERVWNCVKASDSSCFIKNWAVTNDQWPYHGGKPFTINDIKDNFYDFKVYFDSALTKNMKFDEVESDTVARDDPHGYFSKYYIRAWFKYSNSYRKGFGFYMDFVNKEWLIRFSPDYSVSQPSGK
jgi:hypothetical protein